MVNRYDDVREALQMQDVFTNRYTSALGEPEKKVRLLPQNLNGREHTQLRQVLNLWFSPVNVTRLEAWARSRCIELIEELEPRGQCDLAWEFAMQFPTEVFLAHLGLPTTDGPFFLPLVESMFRGFFGGDPAETRVTVGELRAYYQKIIADRIEH